MPVGGEKLAKVVRDVSNAGAKAFKEGRKLVNDALDVADKKVAQVKFKTTEMPLAAKKVSKNNLAAKKVPVRKIAGPKKLATKTPAVKKNKTVVRKTSVK